MGDSETVLLDTKGALAHVVRDGTRLHDSKWQRGRLLVSNRRLVFAGANGKQTVPLSSVSGILDRYDINQNFSTVSEYVGLKTDSDVFLVSSSEPDAFEQTLYGALVDGDIILVKHPAIAGGVLQDTDWQRARVTLDEEAVNLAIGDGSYLRVEKADVGSTKTDVRSVQSERRPVVEVEHTEEGTSVESYIAGPKRVCSTIRAVLQQGIDENTTNIELDEVEKEVLTALFSGVSSFELPEFLDVDPDEVEAVYDRLIDLGVVEEVRVRREVSLRPRGRMLANEVVKEQ